MHLLLKTIEDKTVALPLESMEFHEKLSGPDYHIGDTNKKIWAVGASHKFRDVAPISGERPEFSLSTLCPLSIGIGDVFNEVAQAESDGKALLDLTQVSGKAALQKAPKPTPG